MSPRTIFLVLLILILSQGSFVAGQTLVKLGSQTVDAKIVGGVTYVPLEAFSTALDLEYEYAFVTGSYTLMGSAQRDTSPRTVKFRVDVTDVTVDGRGRKLEHPAIDLDAHVLLPIESFLPLFLAEGPSPSTDFVPVSTPRSPSETSAAFLQSLTPLQTLKGTRIDMVFDARPTWVVRPQGSSTTVDVLFPDTRTDLPLSSIPFPQNPRMEMQLGLDPDSTLRLRIRAPLRPEVDGIFDEVSRMLSLHLRLAPPDPTSIQAEAPREATEAQRAFFQRKLIVISQTSSGRQGSDRERLRHTLTSDLAISLTRLLESTGFRVSIVTPGDDTLSTRDHVSRINLLRPNLVLCLSSSPTTGANLQGRFVVFSLPLEAADAHGLYGPTLSETNRANALCRRLGERLRQVHRCSVLAISDRNALPLKRVFAPGLVLDMSPPVLPPGELTTDDAAVTDVELFRKLATQALYDAIFDWFLEAYVGGPISSPTPLLGIAASSITTSSTDAASPLSETTAVTPPPASPFMQPEFLKGYREAIMDAPNEDQVPNYPQPTTLPPER